MSLGAPSLFAALFVVGALLASCADSASTTDAAPLQDQVAPNDLASDVAPLDAGADAPVDAALDGGVDARPDVPVDRPDVPRLWGDATLVDLGNGIVIPIDPNAVPAPGSECTSDASVRAGDPTVAPPRPIRPLSVSRVTSQRPTFQWVLPEGTTGARIEVCADRCCTRVIQTIDAEGTTTRPMTALPPGVVFWRMFGRRAGVVGSRASYTWEFGVRRRDAPHDTSWGTIRDFNGDGLDDLMVFRPRGEGELQLVPGSTAGLVEPIVTGVTSPHVPSRAQVGDFNGDGLADIAWDERDFVDSWFAVASGSSANIRASVSPSVLPFGDCPTMGQVVAVDWNGDGYSDLLTDVIFGCERSVGVDASVLVGYAGSSQGVGRVPQWLVRTDRLINRPFVHPTGGQGDLDSDGFGDVFVAGRRIGPGTWSMPTEHAILYGSSAGESRIALIPRPTSETWIDGQPGAFGDYDGDGALDFVMKPAFHGRLCVYPSSHGIASPATYLDDPAGSDYLAFSLSAGDINGDGLADVIASAELAYIVESGVAVNRGRAYVFLGSIDGVSLVPVWTQRAPVARDVALFELFGHRTMSPGDMNGDGFDDVVTGDSVGLQLCLRRGGAAVLSGVPDECLFGALVFGSMVY